MFQNLNPFDGVKNEVIRKINKGSLVPYHELKLPDEFEGYELYFELFQTWYKNISELAFLPQLPVDLEEIIIHSPTEIVYKTARGNLQKDTDLLRSDLQLALDFLSIKNQVEWNLTKPFASFYGELRGRKVRITLTHFSVSPENASKVFIRFLNESALPLVDFGINTQQSFFKDAILTKKNILIAGSTGSGKTTFTNSLINMIDPDEHTVILEDTFELVSNSPSTTRMVSDPTNSDKSLAAYLSYAMRMSPSRIILGEIRSDEVGPLLMALNTGHNGLLSTIHANSAKDALDRLALLFKMYSKQDLSYDLILKLITRNIDYVVFLENKKVKEVIEVFGSEKESVFFEQVLEAAA